MALNEKKMEEILNLTFDRLNIPRTSEGASFEQVLQVTLIRELNTFMGLGIILCAGNEQKLVEIIRAYLDMIELMIKEA
jgi:hypothetical protein